MEFIVNLILCQQAQVDSTQFVNFFCDHVLKSWNDIASSEGSDSKLELLKLFAEVTEYCGDLEDLQTKVDTVYDVLMVNICSLCVSFFFIVNRTEFSYIISALALR